MFTSWDFRTPEPGPDLERFGSWDGKHSVSEFGFEFVEYGFSETGGDVSDDAGDGSADGV